MASEREQNILLGLFPQEIRQQLPELIRERGLQGFFAEHQRLQANDPLYRLKVYPRLWFYKFLEKLYRLDQEIADNPSRALENFFKSLKTRYQVSISEEVRDKMKTGPWIFYARHPSQLEPFLMLAAIFRLSGRKDLKAVGAEYMLKLLPGSSQYFTPVYSGGENLTRSLSQQPSFLQREMRRFVSLLRDPITNDEAQTRNTQTIVSLSRFVEGGGMVFITPKMGESESPWQKGIGRIILGIDQQTNVALCPMHVEGNLGMKSFLTGGRFHIHFGRPLMQVDLLNRVDQNRNRGIDEAVIITDVLKDHYGSFLETEKLQRRRFPA